MIRLRRRNSAALAGLAVLAFAGRASAGPLTDGVNMEWLGGFLASTGPGAADSGTLRTYCANCSSSVQEANSAAILAALLSATPQAVYPTPSTTGGLLTYRMIALATTNAANIKATAGQVYGVNCYNHAAYEVTVRLYNTPSTPTPGTTPIVASFPIGPASRLEYSRPLGVAYSAGIGFAATKLIADADATVLVASDVTCGVDYF